MRKLLLTATLLTLGLILGGCSTKIGGTGLQTHFAYPNSNVQPLGKVSASLSKSAFFVYPSITEEDIKGLMDEALSQKSGADLIVDYSIDTKVTSFLGFTSMTTTLEGTAATMDVGIQNLKEIVEDHGY